MGSKGRKREESGKGSNESHYRHIALTERELITLKSVLSGYLGFLRNIGEPKALETQSYLQAALDRLPEHLEMGDIIYFEYEERIAILEAVIGFKLLLVTTFPPTKHRDVALADVERLYQCLINARSLPLN
jgi:hypothetical protein